MRTRFSSHLSPRDARPVSADLAPHRPHWRAARRLTLALAASAPLCAGALMAGPAQAAPTVESDENGPLVQIIKPGYNDVLKGKYRILIQVTPRKYNPESVEMFIDDVSASNGPMAISSFASSSYDFPTSGYTEGRHKLTVRVTDAQGFRGWSEVTVFINNKGVVDTQAPDLRFVGIKPFEEISGSMQIEVNAADNFGVKMLQISINPVNTPNKPAYSWMMNQPPYKVNLDTIGRNIPDGLYILKALAFDSLEQQGDAPPLTFGIVNDQINATRIQDMLSGQRDMQKVLAGEKLDAPAQLTAKTATEAPVKILPAFTPQAPAQIKTPAAIEKIAETVKTPAPQLEDASSARILTPAEQDGTMLQTVPMQPVTSATQLEKLRPKLNISGQIPSNPGIQRPRVNVTDKAEPQFETPLIETPTELSVEGDASEMRATEIAPEIADSTEPQQTTTVRIAEIAPQKSEDVRIAMNSALPVSQRNGGEASLSRAAAIELAVAAPGGAVIGSGKSASPIAIARFGRPSLTGRNITDMPVLSQNPSEESRLSNAELSLSRKSNTRVLSAAQPIAAGVSQSSKARALQISAPTLSQRPLPGRAVSAELVSTPAPKLTRQAQSAALAPTKTNAPALSGSLSKSVMAGERLAPIAPQTATKTVAPNTARGLISKAAPASQRALPIQIAPMPAGAVTPAKVAPTLVAKNSVIPSAPQMSSPQQPRMSESASGIGVPERAKSINAVAAPTRSLDQQRVAALPRPDAATATRNGASIVAVPLNTPLEIGAFNAIPVPAFYRAERNTTLRAVAARYGLPVELVAISNGLTIDAKLASGAEVKLPRPLQVSYNGVPVKGDAPSMLMGDTAVTAFRFMFEKTGGKMEWDATNQRVIAKKDGREITLTIGSNVARVGEREVMMEIAAFLFQGRTMVPLRFFEEGLNAQVEWNPQTGRLVVAMAG